MTTALLNVTTSNWTPITPRGSHAPKRITISEDPSVANWPTTAYLVAAPLQTSPAIQVPAGVAHLFERLEHNLELNSYGLPIAFIKAVASNSTFHQIEEP